EDGMRARALIAAALLALVAGGRAAAAPASVPDTNRIHSSYLDGDFDKATQMLEAWLAAKRPMSHSDSVFAFKHLGVMYAARNDTREKGKYYMYQLLTVEPTARILDMYASDMIYMIFKNIQDEVAANDPHGPDGPGNSTPPGHDPLHPKGDPEKPAAKRTWPYWAAGAAAAVGAGV